VTRGRGEEAGLSDEEIAFYDALAENDGATGDGGTDFAVIARELVAVIKSNVSGERFAVSGPKLLYLFDVRQ
jgi:type I restriction enzyme R subunit